MGFISGFSPAQAFPNIQAGSGAQRPAATPLKFRGLIDEDHFVQLRTTEPINFSTASAVLQGLLIRNQIKHAKNDSSSLKLHLDSGHTDSFPGTSRAALADVHTLVNRPVDVLVKEKTNDMGMLALQSATGKRLMYHGAYLSLGVIQGGAPYGRNDDHAIRAEFQTEYIRDLEYKLMQRAGIASRADVYKELTGFDNLNALQSLAKGKNGLVDGIVVGFDQVVTRADLDAYLKSRRMNAQQKQAFLADADNIFKVPSQPLKQFAPESAPLSTDGETPDVARYRSPAEILKQAAEKKSAPRRNAKDAKTLAFYAPGKEGGWVKVPAENIPVGLEINNSTIVKKPIVYENPASQRGILDDDVIFFNDSFVDETAKQITEALRDLDRKKRQEKNPSNIKIMVNSNGGSILSGLDIRSTIEHSKSKVDVIVTGMAASCGAFLVSSATGNRMITPNGRIMIHDAWNTYAQMPHNIYAQYTKSLDSFTQRFVKAIATASQRDYKEVWEDMKIDVWLNPLESMFYGKRGLTDAIIVGSNPQTGSTEVITKQDVKEYLNEVYGSEQNANQAIESRIASLRSGRRNLEVENHNELDPFENPLRTIETVAARAKKSIENVPALAGSVPRENNLVDQRVVAVPKTGTGNAALSEESRQIIEGLQKRWTPRLA